MKAFPRCAWYMDIKQSQSNLSHKLGVQDFMSGRVTLARQTCLSGSIVVRATSSQQGKVQSNQCVELVSDGNPLCQEPTGEVGPGGQYGWTCCPPPLDPGLEVCHTGISLVTGSMRTWLDTTRRRNMGPHSKWLTTLGRSKGIVS